MRLMRLSQVRPEPGSLLFAESRLSQFIHAVVFIGALCIIAGVAAFARLPLIVRPILWALALLFLLVSFAAVRSWIATFRPTNWVLSITPSRVLVKFRSFADFSGPEELPCVAALDISEISSASERRQTRISHDQSSDGTTVWVNPIVHLDIHLAHENTAELRHAMKDEVLYYETKLGIHAGNRPVLLPAPDVIRIVFSSSSGRLRPSIARALAHLPRAESSRTPAKTEVYDPEEMNEREIQQYLQHLFDSGSEMDAIAILRDRYHLNPSQIGQVIERRKRQALGQCPECGYDLRASPQRCPECGTPRRDEPIIQTIAQAAGRSASGEGRT